ncbi:hypothetical protein FN976_01325 [Caenimonas sedimenti]|uniref:FAD-binding domain-containing protein n=1 Tax=Caenimonas sedimenti TaxID=2596921 RepID=A0A562ZWR7_9BURK|nr:FAD-dependent oxidoreductase [Caenimonas sedimenti]TWO72913.1 hypothetical protein FN976_01325 [Caenimonas sedimenti]
MTRSILILGGGFSGMAAAIALAKGRHQVELAEIDPGWKSYGAGISLGGATFRAFRELGVLDRFLAAGFAGDGVDIFTPQGHPITTLPTPRIAGPDVPGGGAIMRPVLAAIMAEATRAAGVKVSLGTTFEAMQQDAEGVEVTFTDGRRQRYDLVVGADGIHSKTRQSFFADAPKPRYMGQAVWRAVLPRPPEVRNAQMWVGPRIKTGVNPVSQEQMYLFVTEDRAANERIPSERFAALLRDLLAPFSAPLMQQVREQLGEGSQIVYRPLEGLLMPQPWHRGRILLIGDAVHATTPHLASGACIGIEDGLVLAQEVGRATTVDEALVAFGARRWERCRMVVENSARLCEIEMTGGDKAEHANIMRESLMALAQPV